MRDRDEKKPQQNALERFNVAFELMPEFAAGQHDTRQEGAQRRLKPIRIIR
jgi:hypothetical protein